MKTFFGVMINDELEDEIFETEQEAEEYAAYLRSCTNLGSENMHMSNPGDYEYDESAGDDLDMDVVEIDANRNLL